MDYHVTQKLGPNTGMTAEGFLVCRDVALARTGFQLYSDKEVPIPGDSSGRVIVDREADEVFHPEMMASLNGMPVTIDHPMEDVGPHNWREYTVGHVGNVHRGEGILDNLLIGDMVIYDQIAIDAITSGQLREVSVGYQSDYDATGPGRGKQKNIRANHISLVDAGRCGPVCRIADHKTVIEDVYVGKPSSARRIIDRNLRITRSRGLTKLSQARNFVYLHY